MTTRAQQQRNTTATQFNYSDFYVPQTGRIRRNFNCSKYENRRIIRLLKPVTLHLERATMSLYFQGIAEEFERGIDWFEESSIPAYCNDNKERRSWNTTVSTCPRTVGNFTRNRGLPTSRVIVARLRCQVTVRMILRISCI